MPPESSHGTRPLISVICRTTGRPELRQALASVAAQSYRPIQLVLVDAAPRGAEPWIKESLPDIELVVVSPPGPLDRPQAANAGLDAATGELLAFLDEDDWWAEDHLDRLEAFLSSQESALAVYSSVRKTTATGAFTEQVFDRDFDRLLLMHDNYIPIHAMLFHRHLVELRCRFDESLAIYEDWDFWLQLSEHTGFLHLDRESAFYRAGGDSATAVTAEKDKYKPGHPNALAREKLLDKWIRRWSGTDLNRLQGSMLRVGEIEELRRQLRTLQRELLHSHEAIDALETKIRDTEDQYKKTLQQLAQLNDAHERLDADLREILASFSWRVTAPYRYLRRRLDRYLLHPLLARSRTAVSALTAGSAEAEAPIILRIDEPGEEDNVMLDELPLRGWALHESGPVTLTVAIDGLQFRRFQPDHTRQDVFRQFEQWAHAQTCGYYVNLPLASLEYGRHRLQVHCEAVTGASVSAEQEFYNILPSNLYDVWFHFQTAKSREGSSQKRRYLRKAQTLPLSIILIGAQSQSLTRHSLQSLQEQTWQDFEVYCVDSECTWLDDEASIAAELKDRITICESLTGLPLDDLADDAAVVVLQAGVTLTAIALEELFYEATLNRFDLVYSDHDSVDDDGRHLAPVFTWNWAPEYLRGSNYIGECFLIRGFNFAQAAARGYPAEGIAYGCLLELTQSKPNVGRIASVLWSRTVASESQGVTAHELETKVLETFITAHRIPASVATNDGVRSLVWNLEREPLVSIIIPTMGKLSLLRRCIEPLLRLTRYPYYEIIILDNSRGRHPDGIAWLEDQGLAILNCDEDFNWARLNNVGASRAKGELLLFLNDDVEISQPDWLTELVRLALRPEAGAVGCKLYYSNGALQHAGVFLVNYGGGSQHLFHKMHPQEDIYLGLDRIQREVSANTGACLMVSRNKYESVGGFDEALPIVGNDIDFCLRLQREGYSNFWTPRCHLIHHESLSRDNNAPRDDELYLWERWGETLRQGDPFFNPSLDLKHVDCRQRIDIGAGEMLPYMPERLRQWAAPANLMQPGVNLIGYIRADMGLGEAARADARALDAAGIDFAIINFETGNPARMTDKSWAHREIDGPRYDVNLIHINGDYLELVLDELPDYFFADRYNIAYWAWELETIPDTWLASIAFLDEIWAPSRFVADAVRKVCDIPVIVIPHNVSIATKAAYDRHYFGIPGEAFTFLSMYDTRSIAQRKNPNATIRAFMQAFPADDSSVCLLIKLNNASSYDVDRLQKKLGDYQNIVIVNSTFNRDEMEGLLTCIDAYVSLHRSEGFGLGPAEAMSLGKPCILTNWSGNTDYMTADNCLAVDYELVELAQDFGPYKAGQRWAEADTDQASLYMKQLAADKTLANEIGARAQQTISVEFSPDAVGELIRNRLSEIRNSTSR